MNPNQIKHVTNKFESYTATKGFSLGSTGVAIHEGAEVLFDGTTVIFNDTRYPLPTFRGAITLGWMVLTASYDPTAAPVSGVVSANIGLRPAVTNSQSLTQQPTRTAAVTVQSDERVVMTRAASAARAGGRAGYDVEPQEARPVARTFKMAAKTSTDMSYAGAAISQAEAVKISPGTGISESEYLARLSPEEQEKYISEKESRKAIYDADLASKGLATTPTVVGQVRKVSSSETVVDGIRTSLSVSGGTEVFDASTGNAKPTLSTVSAEGISFSNTNGPVRAFQAPRPPVVASTPSSVSDSTADARRTIAKAICADFPDNYSFDDHWKRRLARIQLDYVDRPDVIRAIFAAETDDFKKLILAEFPDAFKS